MCLAIGSGSAHAGDGRRVAVVVGVGAYQAVPQLANPPRDARAIAAALAKLGFDTTLVVDPDRTQLEQAVRTLGEKARSADAAVFFYAGHALEADSRNYLVPVNAHIETRRDLPFETVDLDLVGEQVEGRARIFVAFLDACRDNPFASRLFAADRGIRVGGGLAAPTSDASGTLIAYATAPGRTAEDGDGDDSPFTTALLHHIATPGLEVRQLLGLVRHDVREATDGRQVPWESSALEGDFYFAPGGKADAPAATPLALSAPPMPAGSLPPATSALPSDKPPPAVFADVAPTAIGSSVAPTVGVPPPARSAPPLSRPQSMPPPAPRGEDSLILPRPLVAPTNGLANEPIRPPQLAGIAPLTAPSRSPAAAAARCHVDPVSDMRRSGGAETVMEVASDGHACFFRIALPGTERQPFESLSPSRHPANGNLRIIDNALVVYTPRAGFLGEDRFVLSSRPSGSLTVRVIVKPALPPQPG